jgi:hypothetical protein
MNPADTDTTPDRRRGRDDKKATPTMRTTATPTRSRRTLTAGLSASLLGGLLAVATATVAPQVAGASTSPVAASWSPTPACGSYASATPPPGTVSATISIKGAGGGGGATNSGSGGTGGAGDAVSGTVLLSHTRGAVSVELGCGGGGGTQNGGSGTTNGGAGGAGYAPGAVGGAAKAETASVDGRSSGGGGGGASALCLGITNCATPVVVVGGGGGGGGRWDCTGSVGPGSGGSGSATASPPTVDPGNAGTNGDGTSGGGGGGGTASTGGGGGPGYQQNGAAGGNTPTSSAGGFGGTGGSTSAFSYEAGAGGGGGGGGYTGGGGGGGDSCASGSDAGGGGGAGSSVVVSTYNSATTYGAGAPGGTTAAAGTAGSISLTWNVDNLSVTNPGAQSTTSGTAVPALTITAPHDTTGGNAVTFAATGLPTGLAINSSTGAVTGTPTTAGSYPVTVTATDSQALSASTSFTWTVTNTVTAGGHPTQSSLSGTAITPLASSATDSSSVASIASWSATGLPAGLSIDATTGTIAGTPTTAGTSSVTVTATDSAGFAGSTSFSWTVTNHVAVTDPGPQAGLSGTSITPVTTGAADSSSTATITSFGATGLPTGLTISATTGTISGTPTTAGTSSVTVTATDSAGFAGSTSFSWTVTNHVTIASPGDQSNVSGTAITPVTVTGSDSSSVATLGYTATGLPAGLSVDPTTGTVSGTPTTAGTSSVTVTATDSAGFSATATFAWTVSNIVSVTSPGDQSSVSGSDIGPLGIIAADSSPTAVLGFAATGLPTGLAIDPSTGMVTGSPTVAGTYAVTVTATDGAGYSASASFTWSITNTVTMTDPGARSDVSGTAIVPVPVPTSDSLPGATLTFSDGGSLPAGLTVDPSTGTISGTPTTAGTSSVTITATDDSGYAAQVTFAWTVTNTVGVSGLGDRTDVSGTAISPVAVVATDSSSVATTSFGATGLPPGLSIGSSDGTIAGTPTTAGTYAVTVTATDSSGFHGSAVATWTVTNTVSVDNPGDRSTVSGTAIAPLALVAHDSSTTATPTFSAGGTLPPGLTLSTGTGAVSGTPTTGGNYAVTVTVTDTAGFHGSTSFTWHVTDVVTVTGPGDQTSRVGATVIPVTVGGSDTSSTAHLTWTATGLPPGLSINPSTGALSGASLHSGAYAVTVTATDGAGFHGSAGFTWYSVGASITGVRRSTGPGAGGAKVSITGSDLGGATSVLFGSTPAASFTVNTHGTKITAYAPAEVAGTVDIVVTTSQGPSLVGPADRYTFLGPSVTAMSKTTGPATGGTKVVITGTGLTGATAVHFGTVAATGYTVNRAGTKVTVFSPPQAAGTVDVTVTTPGGTSAAVAADRFTAA